MFKYTSNEISRIANNTNFNKNTTEKVLRLFSILNNISDSEISDMLVLKGGTAINLFLLDLPRLSVDIDFDFNLPVDKENMIQYREKIDSYIRGLMEDEGYYLSDKSKFAHSLDSYVYSYNTTSGDKDLLKIEINYSDRMHILKTINSKSTEILGEKAYINRLSNSELIGAKLNALLVRTTPRDVYDVYNLLKNDSIDDKILVKKICIFYACLGSELPIDFNILITTAIDKITKLNFQKIKETLIPVLHKGVKFDVTEMCEYVAGEIKQILVLDDNELEFINYLNKKQFEPNILFSEYDIEDISKHPMGIWKIK